MEGGAESSAQQQQQQQQQQQRRKALLHGLEDQKRTPETLLRKKERKKKKRFVFLFFDCKIDEVSLQCHIMSCRSPPSKTQSRKKPSTLATTAEPDKIRRDAPRVSGDERRRKNQQTAVSPLMDISGLKERGKARGLVV
ncbi:unnamed protein product [Arctogadus glacialis]